MTPLCTMPIDGISSSVVVFLPSPGLSRISSNRLLDRMLARLLACSLASFSLHWDSFFRQDMLYAVFPTVALVPSFSWWKFDQSIRII